ncbi:37S ribosomal protein S17, mitochondrial [Madurella fahalii]|uniref:37S ribosomal protein S17, mitochondrial n=1 Tax=Madurella fahalii TaxID=1157608 RepID=A0ABQ0GHP8_9PEZI
MTQRAADAAKQTYKTFRELHGVVVSAGLMDRTVKVRVGGQKWNGFVKKFFNDPKTHLVHDPNNSLRQGDVVAITPGFRVSRSKRHVVKHIIAAGSGVPVEERPPIPSWEELWRAKEVKKTAKDERRGLRAEVRRIEAKVGAVARLLKEARGEVGMRERVLDGIARRAAAAATATNGGQ